MKKSISRQNCALGALAIAMMITPGAVLAQDTQETADNENIIVVTGSFIRGTPENAAVPVDVFTSEDLSQSGVSSPLEFIKSLPSVGAVLGDSNQFSTASQGFQGNGSINLRGLGPTRSLVLFNGRRTISAPGDGFVDTNLVPFFAVDRIELLKDGAAATYGSDAIAGVANFITKKGFDGVEMQGDYESIKGSDGNWTGSILIGKNFGNANILAGFGWQHRSELGTKDRDFTLVPYQVNPSGWSAVGNPATYTPRLGNISQGRRGTTIGLGLDGSALGACGALGGVNDSIGFPICRFSFVPFDNLIEEEDRYQGYLQADVELSDTFRFHAEALYSRTDLESLAYSPSFPATQGPLGSGSGNQFFVPSSNPGYRGFIAQSGLAGGIADPFTPGTLANTFGSYATIILTRPVALGGNPRDPERGAGRGSAKNEAWRFSGGFEKDFSDSFRAQLYTTWWRSERDAFAPGVIGSRLQAALEGFGGPNCDRATGTAGQGACGYFNPFINSSPSNQPFNLTNPAFIPGNENDPQLFSWIQVPNGTHQVEEQTVVDLIFSGELGIDFGGGAIGYAFGAQYRENDFTSRPLNNTTNLNVNPCFIEGDLSCVGTSTEGVGSFIFLGGTRPDSVGQNVKALFAEVNIPISDTLEINGAVRFEDYGGSVGSTINPKGAIRWEPTDWLVLRGSIGTTFAGPLATQVSPNGVTSLAGIQAANNNFKSVDIFGNPTTLGPEDALTYNIGAVVNYSGFTVSVDYWTYDFNGRITTTPAQAIASNVVPTPGGLANCGNVFADLVTFQGGCVQGVTTGLDISRVRTDWVNGPGAKTSGLDFALDFTTEVGPGLFSIGGNASHVLKYDFEDFVLRGVVVQPGYSADGFTNYFRDPGTISKWRANGYVNYNFSGLNLRYGIKFIDGVTDDRCVGLAACATTSFGPTEFGRFVESYTQHDFHVTYDLPISAVDAQLQFSVENFTDEDPSAARLEVSYDPFIGNPFGRIFRLGAKVGF